MREKATGTRFSFSACYLVLAPHSSTLTYSVRQRAHLSSLGLRSPLRKGNVSSKQPTAKKTKRQRMPTTRINSIYRIFPVHIHEFIFRGPSTVSNFIGRWLRRKGWMISVFRDFLYGQNLFGGWQRHAANGVRDSCMRGDRQFWNWARGKGPLCFISSCPHPAVPMRTWWRSAGLTSFSSALYL